ncbi:MAG: IclR family transcriptional regulator C-terminal domain-containing protein, partial [Burkholderiaceae bacterium]
MKPQNEPLEAEDAPPPGLQRRDWIAGSGKSLRILESFDAANPRMTAAQAAEMAGITRTAARRHLLTLAHLGYLATDGKLFWLTPRVLRLGQAYLDSSRLARVVQPYLQRVTAGTHEVAYVSVLDGDNIVYIARNGLNRAMNTGFVLGARMPAQVTAAGILLMALKTDAEIDAWLSRGPLRTFTVHTIAQQDRMRAELLRVREDGYALSEQQIDLHYRGVAVALRNGKGDLVGAMNVTMPIGHEAAEDAVA